MAVPSPSFRPSNPPFSQNHRAGGSRGGIQASQLMPPKSLLPPGASRPSFRASSPPCHRPSSWASIFSVIPTICFGFQVGHPGPTVPSCRGAAGSLLWHPGPRGHHPLQGGLQGRGPMAVTRGGCGAGHKPLGAGKSRTGHPRVGGKALGVGVVPAWGLSAIPPCLAVP